MKVYTSIGVYLLVLVMMLQAFLMSIVYLDFKLRQDYIAKVLCINRDKPELHCNGQCVLVHKMNEAHEHEQVPQSQNSKHEIVWLYSFMPSHYHVNLRDIPVVEHFTFYYNFYSFRTFCSLFHPPQLSS